MRVSAAFQPRDKPFGHSGLSRCGDTAGFAHAVLECNLCTTYADVAQLVEQRFRKPQVMGSNPVVGSSLCSQIRASSKVVTVALVEANRFDPR